jgi:hypothetical protein
MKEKKKKNKKKKKKKKRYVYRNCIEGLKLCEIFIEEV